MRRFAKQVGACMLASFGVVLLCLLATMVSAGQRELMDAWMQKKRAIVHQVVEQLRKEGKLPENGIVAFSARVKPISSESYAVRIDELRITPDGGAAQVPQLPKTSDDPEAAKAFEEIYRPRNPSPFWTEGHIRIRDGKVDTQAIRLRPLETKPAERTGESDGSTATPAQGRAPDWTSSTKAPQKGSLKRLWHKLFGQKGDTL